MTDAQMNAIREANNYLQAAGLMTYSAVKAIANLPAGCTLDALTPISAGDIVTFHCPKPLNQLQRREIAQRLRTAVPAGVEVLVVDSGCRVTAQQATPEPVVEPAHIEVVGEIVATEDGNDVRWSIEGGADAIPEGMVLLTADRQITDDTGSGEVYTHPAAAPAEQTWQPIETAPTDGTEFLGWRRGQVATCYRVQRDDCEMWSFGGQSGAHDIWPELRPAFWMPHPPSPAPAAAQEKAAAPDDLAAAGVMLMGRRADHA